MASLTNALGRTGRVIILKLDYVDDFISIANIAIGEILPIWAEARVILVCVRGCRYIHCTTVA